MAPYFTNPMPLGVWRFIRVDQLYVATGAMQAGTTFADVRSFYSSAADLPEKMAIKIIRLRSRNDAWSEPIEYAVELLRTTPKVHGRMGVPPDGPVYLRRVSFVDGRRRQSHFLPEDYWR